METVWYAGPSGGEHVPNPTAAWMIEVLRRGDDYWGPYSPVGVLRWHVHQRQRVPTLIGLNITATSRQQLLFVRHPKRGWYFEYSTRNLPRRRWVVPLDPTAHHEKYIKHWANGEQLFFLAASFVSQPAAERIVTTFLRNRGTSRVVRWASFNRVHPRMDSDAYRERRRRDR
jgi:hypothetical protein